MSLKFNLIQTDGMARRGEVVTAHGAFQTPAFMAVGTAATVKAMTMQQVAATGTEVILGNTYHLMLRPGGDLIESMGGLHKFSGWNGPILTDSGGFQVKSLAGWNCSGGRSSHDNNLVKMSEKGVEFTSHVDGGIKHFMSPERSVQIQHQLDSNITMVLDECTRFPIEHAESAENVALVTRWARRSKDAFIDRDGYGIFGIVQGSVFKDLRARSAAELTEIGFDGYAIGGLTQGEPYDVMLDIIAHTTAALPMDRPRYLMGAGTPLDILGAVERGIDMFDCVMPTRAGRTAQAFTRTGTLNLRNAKFKNDPSPLDSECTCPACRDGLSCAYLHHLTRCNEILGATLLSQHNLHFYQDLMRDIRTAIEAKNFDLFKKQFIIKYTNA